MFILHSSNKTEHLFEHLAAVIGNTPLASPLAKEVFLIQSQGMERWLSQQLAGKFGVWGNYEYLFPSKFFSFLAQQVDLTLSDAAFDRQRILWRLDGLLRHLGEHSHFQPLRFYLSGSNQALRRFQLAQQLSQLFDQYQIMRPDLLATWQQGRLQYGDASEQWQKALWLALLADTKQPHRGQLWQAVIDKLSQAPEQAYTGQLPERIFVFGVNAMPPMFLAYLQAVARHCQVHYFLLNPAQVFWADLPSKRQQLLENSTDNHPLLVALGQQGREFQDMLLEQVQFELELDSFDSHAAQSLNNLQQLQNDILDNIQAQQPLTPDTSISIHACHSRLREVEVLKDQLLQALAQDPQLQLRDMVVMAPDIQAYEPFIAAVFVDIQHAIADRSLRLSNKALDSFIQFLSLSQSRFGWQSVLDLLEQNTVYPSFGLSETDLELLVYWLQATRVRWGQSAQHKAALDLPAISDNTWQAMLDRLFMGYAVGSDAEFIDGVLPFADIEGASAQALGGLYDFLNLLFKASKDLQQPLTRLAWSNKLYYYADQLLAQADPLERQQLNELLAELSADLQDNPANTKANPQADAIELQVIISWLQGMVEERKSSNGFLRGQLTFCSMLPMRSIPFKVIALLGINEGEFPKLDRKPTFDLLDKHFRKGDRSRRADDRYQFLEILLSARQQLIITYLGQSITSNKIIPPSVVISELLEVLASQYQLTDLLVKHPLHAFSRKYFTETNGLFSFSDSALVTAKALQAAKPEPSIWWTESIPAQPQTCIEIHDLLAFFHHPQKYFLARQLGLRFNGISAAPEEREPFVIDSLDNYLIQQQWLQQQLHGIAPSTKKLQAQGSWLPCAAGEIEFSKQQQLIDAFVEQLNSKHLGEPLPDLLVDIAVGDYRLVGKLGNRYQHANLHFRFANLKGKDFMVAWLQHLIGNQIQQQPTYLVSSDEDLLFLPDYDQGDDLQHWLDIYQQGQQQPDAFFVEAAMAYLKQAAKPSSRASTAPLMAAIAQLEFSLYQGYEPELRQLFWHKGQHDLVALQEVLGEGFERQCQQLLLPVWRLCH